MEGTGNESKSIKKMIPGITANNYPGAGDTNDVRLVFISRIAARPVNAQNN